MSAALVPADGAGLTRARAVLDAGGVVALPTDTVYGLAARIDRPRAVDTVFALKDRPSGLALPVLVGSVDQVQVVAASFPPGARALAAAFWPGPLTLVVDSGEDLPSLGGDGVSVGVRLPDHPVARALCRASGPLAVTSANRHARPPCTTAGEVVAAFAEGGASGDPAPRLALVLDGGRCDGVPSTVIDCRGAAPACLRPGGVPFERALDVWG